MKKMLCILLVLHFFCINLFSQSESFKTAHLPVFVVVDKEVSAILDSFIMEAKNYSSYYPAVTFFMYVDLYDDKDMPWGLGLNLRKQEKHSDSIILYKHPNCRQIFVSHNNHLFETIICQRPDFDNKIHFPTAILQKTRKKYRVYYKESPLDYFRDNQVKGEIVYESQLLGWYYYYYHGHWQEDIKISF